MFACLLQEKKKDFFRYIFYLMLPDAVLAVSNMNWLTES